MRWCFQDGGEKRSHDFADHWTTNHFPLYWNCFFFFRFQKLKCTIFLKCILAHCSTFSTKCSSWKQVKSQTATTNNLLLNDEIHKESKLQFHWFYIWLYCLLHHMCTVEHDPQEHFFKTAKKSPEFFFFSTYCKDNREVKKVKDRLLETFKNLWRLIFQQCDSLHHPPPSPVRNHLWYTHRNPVFVIIESLKIRISHLFQKQHTLRLKPQLTD